MELSPLDILYHIANILILFVLLRLIIYKPVRKFMVARSERLQKQIDDTASAEKAVTEEKAKYEKWNADANDSVKQIIKEGNQKAVVNSEKIVDEAKKQAEQIIQDARVQAQAETQKAMDKMQDQITELAIEIAGKILKREISLEDNRASVTEFFQQVK